MIVEKNDLRDFLEENDVKFVRLMFSDVFGLIKNISVMPTEMDKAISAGIPVEACAVTGDRADRQTVYLIPDLTTAALLPWRPSTGRVVRFFCEIRLADGSPYELDCRRLLRRTLQKRMKQGLSCTVGAECEFYLFRTDADGEPTSVPFDRGTYLDAEPRDQGQNVRREICLTLEDMGVSPQASMHEAGPGQNEIDFRYSDALTSADNVITLRSVVETVAAGRGLYATFDPKPIPNEPGSGFHINLMPYRMTEPQSRIDAPFAAGILTHAAALSAFLNPVESSYLRLREPGAPSEPGWSRACGSPMMLLPEPDAEGRTRVMLRSPDPMANPYLAYALLLEAGFTGVEQALTLPEAGAARRALPATVEEAAAQAHASDFIRAILPEQLLRIYTHCR